ncbi:MAG: hypothetical protein ACKO1O_15165 [Erythrobacter sp.]
MTRRLLTLPLVALAFAVPAAAQAQNYADLPPLSPMTGTELRPLPSDMRSAPMPAEVRRLPTSSIQAGETVTTENGVETITRTRRIDAPHPLPATQAPPMQGYLQPTYAAPMTYAQPVYAAPVAYAPAPAVFERQQWIDECRRRTQGRNRDETGLIIGGLLGAIAGGFAGYEIAGAGDRVLGSVLGAGGGGLVGGLLGSLFGGRKKDRYDCEAALDSYLSQGAVAAPRVASREISYAPAAYGYGYPADYSYGYTYAPPPQTVLVPVRTEVQQKVVVRETERYETYTVPGAARTIPAPAVRPSPKMIKTNR